MAAGCLTATMAAGMMAQGARGTTNQALIQANAALLAGEADKALALLQDVPQQRSEAAEARNLECRVRLTLEEWDAAASACEQAVRLEGQNSWYHLWLGRALGERAGRASFLSAYSLAKRVRDEFETAVRLDPRNAEALADLGEFYRQAPGIVGGGTAKALDVAAQMDKVDPARALELRSRIAEESKDYGTAERDLKQAIPVAAHPAFQWMGLASFYQQRKRWSEMEAAIHSCVSAAERDKHASVALYDGASVLTNANRDPALAAKMLQDYLASPSKTDEAPAFVAHLRLAKLKDELGDPNGANRERSLAQGMAREYRPKSDARH